MKSNGTYAPLDLRFDEHPKYFEYGAAEMGLIACGITCANRLMSDGVLPKAWPRRRFGPEIQSTVDQLVKDGVWKIRPDGNYEVVGYLDYNRSKAEIVDLKAKKADAGKRGGQKSAQARAQAPASALATASGQPPAQASAEPRSRSRSDPQTETDPQTEPTTETSPPGVANGTNGSHTRSRSLPASELRLWGPLRIDHYQAAAAKALDRTWLFDEKQLHVLYDVIAVHCQDKTRIEAWIDAVVPAFVAATADDESKFWSSHQPRGLAKWLNEGGARKRGGQNEPTTGTSGHVVDGRIVRYDDEATDG